jgi:DNA-binding response OmpR family regulator/tetratricopeptide (TPR) repeat protein
MSNKSDTRILIVEDDPSLGPSLAELFNRAGYDAYICPTPERAENLSDQLEFHAILIDLMLPKINGIDFAISLRKKLEPVPPIFLMTGVFKDKNFIKDAIVKTNAVTLFEKPFSMEHVFSTVEAELRKLATVPDIDPLPHLLTQEECNSHEILEAIETQSSFHAYQIPLILALLTRQGINGELGMKSYDGDALTITWVEGKIVDVHSTIANSQLGELLIEHGFVMPEDVEEILATTRSGGPLGRRLINAAAISPHALDLVREEQHAIRLSQFMQNTSVQVSWKKKKIEMKETFHPLPPSRLKLLMSDWILSKIPPEWLRSFYLQFSERIICWRGKMQIMIEGPKANMTTLPLVVEKLQSRMSLQELLHDFGDAELSCLQALHTLILERKIYFGERRLTRDDFRAKINRYQRLLTSFESKDYFQILGISERARSTEIHRAYTELAKRFHPDKISPDAPDELKMLCHKIFSMISNAQETLSDDLKRKAYLDEASKREATRALELQPFYDQAVADVWAQKYGDAVRKFDDLIAKKIPLPDLIAYSYWAKIKVGQRISEKQFFEIPPEGRHSPVYLLAKGLFYKSQGHYQRALDCFRNAKLLDKHFSEAHREIVELMDELGTDSSEKTFIGRILGDPIERRKSPRNGIDRRKNRRPA